jgi:carboxyl-terminal processing protease
MRAWWIGPTVAGALGLGAAIGAGAVAFSQAQGDGDAQSVSSADETFRRLELFADVLARVQTDYVVQPKDEELIEGAINGMLASLDPHSSYLAPDGFRDMQVQTRGEYGGLGLEVTAEEGVVTVVSPMDDTPASRAGLKTGDKLIAINGESIIGVSVTEAARRMRGPIGTSITVTVARGEDDPFPVTLTRQTITVKPVRHRLEGDYGYIRVTTFNENAGAAVADAVRDIKRQLGGRLKGVVLDLRNNPGGLVDQAVLIADHFLDGGEVVSTRGRRPEDIERYNAQRGELLAGVPMVVMINGGSASASEIVAGALQDRGRATVLGMDSFGKGSVQTVIPLKGGQEGALRLTTAKYYTPAGRSIQAAGIAPDVEVAPVHVTAEDLKKAQEAFAAFQGEESLPHALDNEQGAKRRPPHLPADMPPADWKESEDYQLKRAFEVLRDGPPKPAVVPASKQEARAATAGPG